MKAVNKVANYISILIPVVIGIIALVIGISLHSSILKQNQSYTGSAEATVTGYNVVKEEITNTDSDGFTTTEIVDMYYPIFEYTVDGKTYSTVSDTGSGSKAYTENSTVKIKYLPSDPTQLYVEGEAFRNFIPYILYAIFVIAVVFTVRSLKSLKK